jgi:hypothetical protein
MTFKEAVETTLNLSAAFQAGLQALRAQDRPHIEAQNTRRLTGSVDLDSALQRIAPYANRWDFAIGYQHTNRKAEVIYWTELHTASDSEMRVVINKARWLLAWLRDGGRKLVDFENDIVWVSSGTTSLVLTGPQKKKMAQAGLQHVGSRLRIRNERRGSGPR